MEEITLTGGTLLPTAAAAGTPTAGSSPSGSGVATTPTMTPAQKQAQQEQMLKQFLSQQQHSHSHSHHHHGHSHSHGGACCNKPAPAPAPRITLKAKPADLVREQSEEEILKAIRILTKMGDYTMMQEILTAWKEFKGADYVETTALINTHQPDDEGHTLLHWAAKRTDDIRFVQYWTKYIPLTAKTTDSTGMTPLHWAVTETNAFAILQYILTTPVTPTATPTFTSHTAAELLEARDASGCTPLLLAAQHGHVETVAYLVHQHHARLDALDDSGDSATHWAAYKGSAEVLGLLAYYEKQEQQKGNSGSLLDGMIQRADSYGQTPLHLAALRGHSSACQYIMRQIAGPRNQHAKDVMALLTLKDKNGRTPYDLAVHKQKPHTAAILQQAQRGFGLILHGTKLIPRNKKDAKLLMQIVFSDWLCNAHQWRQWMGIPTGVDDPMDVAPSFPNYYVIFNIVANIWFTYSTYVPLFNLGKGVMWDCTLFHILQATLTGLIIITLYKTQTTNPGRLDDSLPEIGHWRRLYGETLASYADTTDAESKKNRPTLCHTCHIARPTRSKHDRSTGACVLLFDHNCPFVGNTIGLYNYKWFYLFLLFLTWYLLNHIILLIMYATRQKKNLSMLTLAFGIYLGLHILMAGAMFIYHTQLTLTNMTTNEHMNVQRYNYFWTGDKNGPRNFKNPFYQGSMIANLVDRFQPSHASYMLPEQQESLLSGSTNNTSRGLEMV